MFIISLLSWSGLIVWVLNLSLNFGLPVEGHFHNESSFWVRSRRLGFELALVYLWSCLAVWVLNLSLGFGLPVERHVYNDSSFRVRSSCLGFELIAGLWSAC